MKYLETLRRARALAAAGTTATLVSVAWGAPSGSASAQEKAAEPRRDRIFNHVGTFSVPANLPASEPLSTITSAEIVDVSGNGNLLMYTDSPTGRLGFVNIANPDLPKANGYLDLGGEPTSVAVNGNFALVAVNTSASFANPSGELVVVKVNQRSIVRRMPLAGQPDSVAISPDGRYAAIVIENERDEDLNDGLIPQPPAGLLQVVDCKGNPEKWTLSSVALTGLAEVATSDPEPEYVDINEANLAVVSMQENNHLVVINLANKQIVKHFSAGSVTVDRVDATEEELGPQETGLIGLTETITRRREPDSVVWIDSDTFATANEGDYEDADGAEGGGRGFTLFNVDGSVEWESGNSFEHMVVSIGHFPQGRAGNKGNEPEGLEVAKFDNKTLLFVGSERANVVGVYDVTSGTPEFVQVLPTGIGPEGIRAIPSRGLLAVSSEADGQADGFDIRSLVTLYTYERREPRYPMLVSAYQDNTPIPWVAISGLAGDPHDAKTMYAVSDSFLAQGYIYRVNLSANPARIEARIPVGGADGSLDLEGVAVRPEGGFWLASEGRVGDRDDMVLRVSATGEVLETIKLPAALSAHATSSGFEGIAATGSAAAGDETLYVVIQREWADDPAGLVKIGRYSVATASWTFAHYPLDPVESPNGGWVGLSEITALPGGKLAIVERDNQIEVNARIKRLYRMNPAKVAFAPYGGTLPVINKRPMRDVLEQLSNRSISIPDKLEGVGVTADGRLFLATDNDGVDENYGETLFFEIGFQGSLSGENADD